MAGVGIAVGVEGGGWGLGVAGEGRGQGGGRDEAREVGHGRGAWNRIHFGKDEYGQFVTVS